MMSRVVEPGILNQHFSKYLMFFDIRWLLSVIFVGGLAILIVKRRKYVSIIDNLPGPKSHFFIGNILQLGLLKSSGGRDNTLKVLRNFLEGCEILYKKGIFRLWFITSPMVFISNYKGMETVIGSQTLTHKSSFYKFFEIGTGQGLVTSIIDNYFPIFNKNSWIAVRKIHKKLEDGIIELNKIITMYTLDSICETTMGITINAQNEGDRNYAKSVEELSVVAVEIIMSPWLWLDFILRRTERGKEGYKQVDIFQDFSKNVIKARLEELKKLKNIDCDKEEILPNKRLLFLDLLLEEHMKDRNFTLEDVREEVDTFLVAGHDTSASGLIWSLYLVGLHPKVQEKIHAEIDELFDDDIQRDVTQEDLKRLKYIDCVFREGLRIFPPAPFIGRKLTEDTTINGYLVPKDTECWFFIYALHRDPEIFPEPEKFDPDRFLPENSKNRPNFTYLPFSAGPRNCIGQKFASEEIKILMTNILRHFRIESIEPRDKIVPSGTAIMHPPGPILVRCHKRRENMTF